MKKLIIMGAAIAFSASAFAMQQDSAWIPHNEVAAKVVKTSDARTALEAKNQHATEVFIDLKDIGHYNHKLVAATSPTAGLVQLHKMTDHGKKMEEIKFITLQKGKMTDLHKGGMHIMLIGTYHHLTKGDMIPVTLIFADGSWKKVLAPVK